MSTFGSGGFARAGDKPVFLPAVMTDAAVTETVLLERPTNQVIVKMKVDAGISRAADVAGMLSRAGGVALSVHREMDGGLLVMRTPSLMGGAEFGPMFARIMALGNVEYIEPDAIMQTTLTPNDPSFATQWDLQAPTTGNVGANLPAAWDITTGNPNLVVAVIDTGRLNHADLAGKLVAGYDFISDAQVANDGGGRDANELDPGDWITSAEAASGFFAGCQVRNSSWHGTHVAGTIGAATNNSTGVAGINWQSKIQHVRVLGKCGGFTSDIVDGMRWAAGLAVSGVPANATPARVLNLSLGGSGACSATYQNAVNAIVAAGAVVVVAAGNSTANAANYSPASCNGVITVASVGKAGNLAYYSNFGATVEIAAQGGDKNADAGDTILSTLNSGTTSPVTDIYTKYQGTSMATPHVAGVASLMLSIKPTLTPAQVTQLLQQNVTAFPAGSTCNTSNCGPGILNAGAAVLAAQNFGGGGGGTTQTFNGGAISINAQGNATPYGSSIAVSGMSGNTTKVVVTLNNMTHTYPDDVDILLVSPAGVKLRLMSDAGGGNGFTSGRTFVFDDAATASMSNSGAIAAGTYKPTNHGASDTFPAPAPAGAFATALSAYNGSSPNGTWRLYVVDDASGDSGAIGSWSIAVTTQ